LGVEGLGFRAQGSGLRVQGSGFRVQALGFRVEDSGFRVQSVRVGGNFQLKLLVERNKTWKLA